MLTFFKRSPSKMLTGFAAGFTYELLDFVSTVAARVPVHQSGSATGAQEPSSEEALAKILLISLSASIAATVVGFGAYRCIRSLCRQTPGPVRVAENDIENPPLATPFLR